MSRTSVCYIACVCVRFCGVSVIIIAFPHITRILVFLQNKLQKWSLPKVNTNDDISVHWPWTYSEFNNHCQYDRSGASTSKADKQEDEHINKCCFLSFRPPYGIAWIIMITRMQSFWRNACAVKVSTLNWYQNHSFDLHLYVLSLTGTILVNIKVVNV